MTLFTNLELESSKGLGYLQFFSQKRDYSKISKNINEEIIFEIQTLLIIFKSWPKIYFFVTNKRKFHF